MEKSNTRKWLHHKHNIYVRVQPLFDGAIFFAGRIIQPENTP